MTYQQKSKTFLYKRAAFLNNVGKETLQSLLDAALAKFPTPDDRQEQPTITDPHFRWIYLTQKSGRSGATGEMRCCEFISVTRGAHQGAVDFSVKTSGKFDMDALPAPVGKEYLEGSVYFGVFKNHVVVVQSSTLKTQDLETYLNWLLGPAKAGLIGSENKITLEDNLPPEELELNDATGIEFDAPVQFKPTLRGTAIEEGERKKLRNRQRSKKGAAENQLLEVSPFGEAWEALKAFLGDRLNLPSSLDAEDMLKAGRMTVKLALNWTNPRKEEGSEFAREITHNLRHVTTEFDYAIKTKSGKLIGRDKFKPEQKFNIPWGKVRPEFDKLFPKMLEWLETLRKTGKISSS